MFFIRYIEQIKKKRYFIQSKLVYLPSNFLSKPLAETARFFGMSNKSSRSTLLRDNETPSLATFVVEVALKCFIK